MENGQYYFPVKISKSTRALGQDVKNEELKFLKPDSRDSRTSDTEVNFTDLSSHGYEYGF